MSGDELTTDEWKRVIRGLRDANLLGVTFTGGDALLRDDVLELMRYAVKLGLRVNTTLNGFTLTEAVAKDFMETGLAAVQISLDDLGDAFAKIRGVANAGPRAAHSVDMLRRFADGRTRVGLAITIMKDTVRSVRDVARYGLERGCSLQFNLVHFTHSFSDTPYARAQYELDADDKRELRDVVRWLANARREHPNLLPSLTELEWMVRYFDDYHQRSTPCYQTMVKICVEPNGDVRPCCSMPPVGNLLGQELKGVAESSEFLEVARKGLAKDCPGCSCYYPMNLQLGLARRAREYALRLGLARAAWR